jgi:hypothetical protein
MDRFLGLRQQPPTLHTMVDSINNPRTYQKDLHPDWHATTCPLTSAVSGSTIQIE